MFGLRNGKGDLCVRTRVTRKLMRSQPKWHSSICLFLTKRTTIPLKYMNFVLPTPQGLVITNSPWNKANQPSKRKWLVSGYKHRYAAGKYTKPIIRAKVGLIKKEWRRGFKFVPDATWSDIADAWKLRKEYITVFKRVLWLSQRYYWEFPSYERGKLWFSNLRRKWHVSSKRREALILLCSVKTRRPKFLTVLKFSPAEFEVTKIVSTEITPSFVTWLEYVMSGLGGGRFSQQQKINITGITS
jgi:hypothetical protein